jgi:hypothetical protein
VLQALAGRLGIQPAVAMRSVEVDELEPGMTFAEDVYTTSGLILPASGWAPPVVESAQAPVVSVKR